MATVTSVTLGYSRSITRGNSGKNGGGSNFDKVATEMSVTVELEKADEDNLPVIFAGVWGMMRANSREQIAPVFQADFEAVSAVLLGLPEEVREVMTVNGHGVYDHAVPA